MATHGAVYRDLDATARTEVLKMVDQGEAATFGQPDGPTFVNVVREHVIEGLFCDPAYGGNADAAGWRWLGYQGPPSLESDYSAPGDRQ
jgi:hypothetical protein